MSKAILEKKLYLAKESPEPIFDLSECGLKHVPSGIFAVIKVYRKEFLYLQNNKLCTLKEGGNLKDLSFIKVLDLSFNKFSKLPPDIQYLNHLQILRLDNNELITLPYEIGNLSNLEQLVISSNKIKKLPDSISQMKKLQYLDLRKNPSLNILPSLHMSRNLKELLLDQETTWKSPPKNVVEEGVSAILSYFLKENGIDETDHFHLNDEPKISQSLMQLSMHDKYVQDNLRRLEKEKEERISRKLETERHIFLQKEKEFLLHEQNQNRKDKLLENLITEQSKIDEELSKHQKRKSIEQSQFINQLLSVENTADEVIKQLLAMKNAHTERQVESVLSSLLEEPSIKEPLHCQEVLESMESLFVQEEWLKQKFEEYELAKRHVVNISNSRNAEINDKIFNVLLKQKTNENRLVNKIKEDSDLQFTALVMLFEKTDDQNIELQNKILLIENQLSNLTALELNNKAMHLNKHINDLSERRTALSELLLDTFAQQQSYREQMLEQLKAAERKENNKQYWLMQYQRLLECTSKKLPQAMNSLHPNLIYELAMFGVSHCAPFLSCFDTETDLGLSKIDDESLKNVGIKSEGDRASILKAIKHLVCENRLQPSAPYDSFTSKETFHQSSNNFDFSSHTPVTQNTFLPSAPPETSINLASSKLQHSVLDNECVICLDEQSNMIFLNCGHICCCANCSENLKICPMCRCDIERKLHTYKA